MNTENFVSIFQDLEKPVIQKPGDYMGITTLDDNIDQVRRRRIFKTKCLLYQSVSHFWTLFKIKRFSPDTFYARFPNGHVRISGSIYLYLPAFTPVEWSYMPGAHEYEAFTSFAPADPAFPEHPFIFPAQDEDIITDYNSVADLLRRYKHHNKFEQGGRSYVAEKTKLFLDQYFSEHLSFKNIADDIDIPYSTMTAGFKQYYGTTPIQYRNILRTFEAMRLIKNGDTVTKAGMQAGFTGMTQYNQNFHRIFGVPPSVFLK